MDLLLKAGAKPNLEVDDDYPLTLAQSLNVTRRLLAAGADPDLEHGIYGISVKQFLVKRDVAFSRIFGDSGGQVRSTPLP